MTDHSHLVPKKKKPVAGPDGRSDEAQEGLLEKDKDAEQPTLTAADSKKLLDEMIRISSKI